MVWLLCVLFFCLPSWHVHGWYAQKSSPACACWSRQEPPVHKKIGRFLGELFFDVLAINRHLFSIDTAKILTGFTPAYLVARRLDEPVQQNFYDQTIHKNINQMYESCHKVAKVGVGVPMVALSGLAFYGWTDELRLTGRIFALGLPFVHWTKDLIKTLEAKPCLRPWHEDFSAEKRSPGGFPSGHMANITYAASLFGMRFGLPWAVPLGAFASFVFADFINCNRHYFSQLLAGAAFGLIYAVAAQKVIERKLHEQWAIGCGLRQDGGMQFRCAYLF